MKEEISEREVFENAFYHFVEALRILELSAESQCERMGNYNVAWELQHDVSAGGLALVSSPSSHLTEEQAHEVVRLASTLTELPKEAITAEGMLTTNHEGSIAAMTHPSWLPIRIQANHLLQMLEPAIQRNASYFDES